MNQKGFANIILIVIIVAIAGAMVYFTITRKSGETIAPVTPSTQNQISENKTANWKICENAAFGYKFSYPNEFQVTTNDVVTNAGGDKKIEPIPGCSKAHVFISKPSSRENIVISVGKALTDNRAPGGGFYDQFVFNFENRKDNSFPIEQLRDDYLRQGTTWRVKKEFTVQNERIIWMETNRGPLFGEQLTQYVPYIIFGHNQNLFSVSSGSSVDDTVLENIVRSFFFEN